MNIKEIQSLVSYFNFCVRIHLENLGECSVLGKLDLLQFEMA